MPVTIFRLVYQRSRAHRTDFPRNRGVVRRVVWHGAFRLILACVVARLVIGGDSLPEVEATFVVIFQAQV